MANKSIISVHEIVDAEANSDHAPFHPDPRVMLGDTVEFLSQNINPHSSSPVSYRNHFTGHSSNDFFYPNQQKSVQNYQPIINVGVSYTTPPNFTTNPHMASSSSQTPHLNGHGFMGVTMEDNGERFQAFENSRRLSKRKNPEIIPGNSYFSNVASTSGSSSSNAALHPWNKSVESGANVPQFMPSEHQHGILLPMDDGYQQVVRSRPGMIRLQREPAVVYHQNHLLQGNYIGQSFQSASNTWVDQCLPRVGDAGSSNGNYARPTPASLGRSSSRVPIDIGSFATLGYQDSSLSRNPAGNSPSPSLPSHHHQLPHLQGIHTHIYNHHQVVAPPYGHSVNNNTFAGLRNPSTDPMNSVLGFPRSSFSFNSPEWICGPHQRHRQAPYGDRALTNTVSSEDFATVQYSGLGAENLIDRHRDTRMDIDGMTYEELLALEELIGDVKTGLSEEYIVKHLKTRLQLLHPSLSLSIRSPCHSHENGTCIICQVEFGEKERIGTLDCGHDYHADCIKQWLMVKNLCPICKTTALAAEKGRP